MNQQFAEFGEEGGFATALVSTFFAPTQTFALCNAGHPAPLLFRRATSQWTELANKVDHTEAVTDTPLGVIDEATMVNSTCGFKQATWCSASATP